MFHGIHVMRRNLIGSNWIKYQLMGEKGENRNLSQVLIYKNLRESPSEFHESKKMDRKSSDKHRSTPLPGETQPKS